MGDAVADFLAVGAYEKHADRELISNGRYKIPHPVTGEVPKYGGFQRTTTLAKMMDDSYAIEKWRMARTMRGLVLPDQDNLVLELAAAAGEGLPGVHDEDKVKAADRKLNAIAERAQEAAGSTSKREQGTALHALCERINRGERGVTAPGKWAQDLAAYRKELDRIGLKIATTPMGQPACELILVNTRFNVAGRGDFLAHLTHRPHVMIGDLKTGGVEGKGLSIGVQLAIYATADWVYDFEAETYTPMAEMFPDLDQTEAIVIHLPAGSGECAAYQVPLVDTVNKKGQTVLGGISLAEYAVQVREARSRSAGIIVPYDTTGGTWPTTEPAKQAEPDPVPEDRTTWIRQRLTAMVHDDHARGLVVQHWPEGVPAQPPDGGWTDEQTDAIAAVLASVERVQGASFPPPDPKAEAELAEIRLASVTPIRPPAPPRAPTWPVPHEPGVTDTKPSVVALEAVRAAVGALTAEQQLTIQLWGADGKRHRCRWDLGTTTREAQIVAAAARCVADLWCDDPDDFDALVRAALAACLDGTLAAPFDSAEEVAALIAPSWDIGAILGHLSYGQAVLLEQIAARFAADDDETVARLGRLLVAAPAAPPRGATTHDQRTRT